MRWTSDWITNEKIRRKMSIKLTIFRLLLKGKTWFSRDTCREHAEIREAAKKNDAVGSSLSSEAWNTEKILEVMHTKNHGDTKSNKHVNNKNYMYKGVIKPASSKRKYTVSFIRPIIITNVITITIAIIIFLCRQKA